MRRPMMVRLAVVRVLDFARRHSPSARGLIIPAVIVFIGVIAGSYRSELLPFIVAAVVAGASLAALNSPRRERKPGVPAAAEPERFAAPAPAPPLDATSTTDRYMAELHRFIEVDYVFNILGGTAPPDDMTPMAEHDWQVLQSRGLDAIPTPDELTQFFTRHDRLTPQRAELIEDYRSYIEHRTHRHPASWAERQRWCRQA